MSVFPDVINVSKLELSAHIGVPEEERKVAQRLTVDLRLVPMRDFSSLADDLANTVDYFALTRRVRALAAERPWKLIETLVDEIAGCCLDEFAVREVEVELYKYILSDAAHVSVRVRRCRV
jgi:FolB domain-containing protein